MTIGKGTIEVTGPLMVMGIVCAAEVDTHAVIVCATVTIGGAIEMPAVAKDTCEHHFIGQLIQNLSFDLGTNT